MKHSVTTRGLLIVLSETGLIVLAVTAAAYLRLGSDAFILITHESGLIKTLILAGVTQACLYYADLYDLRISADRRELFIRVLRALGWRRSFWPRSISGSPISSSAAASSCLPRCSCSR